MQGFLLDRFESCINAQAFDDAISMLFDLDSSLNRWPFQHLGALMNLDAALKASPAEVQRERFLTRAAAALSKLFSDPRLELTDERMQKLLVIRPLVRSIYAATGSGSESADCAARALLPRTSPDAETVLPSADAVKRLCLLITPESRLDLDFASLWKLDLISAANLCIGIAGETFPGNARAHAQRERALTWLAERMEDIGDIARVEVSAIWMLYMNCTYSATTRRHAVKHAINALVRKKLSEFGFNDLETSASEPRPAGRRPIMYVLAERFVRGHSIVRTHSRNLAAARKDFELVAFCPPDSIDDEGRALFDRTYDLPSLADIPACVRMIREHAQIERPEVFYMPSVGMSALTVFMSNIRIARLQIAALGHPATTHSDRIDYISVEDDFVGDPSCFTEPLLRLPKDGQPYLPSGLLKTVTPRISDTNATTQIAIAASFMKLNPAFLEACRAIVERSAGMAHLHFHTGAGTVFKLMHLARNLDEILPSGSFTIHGFEPYSEYLDALNRMDMFLSPFPFGNTNGIVDALTVGLPGVCKTGPEVFERIDGALFARAWMPGWLVADTIDEYVDAAVRLATDHRERRSLRKNVIEANVVQRLFEGRPEAFADSLLALLRGR